MLEKVLMTGLLALLCAALFYLQYSMQWPLVQKYIDAGFSKIECADPQIRALVIAKESPQK